MKGLWVLPTRRRLAKLQVFFDKAMENGITTPGVCLVQKDELNELKKEYEEIKKPDNWKILPTQADGFGDKHREVWRAIQALEWIGIACDDLRPQTPQWDQTMLSKLDGKNIVTCADGQQNALRMAGITVFSGGLARAMGYLFPPEFWHTFVDNVWEDLGRATNCWTYVPEVLITHDHPFTQQKIDPAKADDTTYKSYGQSQRDQQAYLNWKKNEFEGCVERIRCLQRSV